LKIALDTSAIISVIQGEAEAGKFLETMTDNESLYTGATLLEAVIVLGGKSSFNPVEDVNKLLELIGGGFVAFDAEMTAIAQQAFLRYGKGRHQAKLNFGDCMSYALAKSLDIPLLYKGNDFALTDIEAAA
jgi:ribonuclease VapC